MELDASDGCRGGSVQNRPPPGLGFLRQSGGGAGGGEVEEEAESEEEESEEVHAGKVPELGRASCCWGREWRLHCREEGAT